MQYSITGHSTKSRTTIEKVKIAPQIQVKTNVINTRLKVTILLYCKASLIQINRSKAI